MHHLQEAGVFPGQVTMWLGLTKGPEGKKKKRPSEMSGLYSVS